MINQNECLAKALHLRSNARDTIDIGYQRQFEAMAIEWDNIGTMIATHHALADLIVFDLDARAAPVLTH